MFAISTINLEPKVNKNNSKNLTPIDIPSLLTNLSQLMPNKYLYDFMEYAVKIALITRAAIIDHKLFIILT